MLYVIAVFAAYTCYWQTIPQPYGTDARRARSAVIGAACDVATCNRYDPDR